MFEYRVINGSSIDPGLLVAAKITYCSYWGCFVLWAENEKEAYKTINKHNIDSKIERIA